MADRGGERGRRARIGVVRGVSGSGGGGEVGVGHGSGR